MRLADAEQLRRLAQRAAHDLGVPFGAVNLLRLAHWPLR